MDQRPIVVNEDGPSTKRLCRKTLKPTTGCIISDFLIITQAAAKSTVSYASESMIWNLVRHFSDKLDRGTTILISSNLESFNELDKNWVIWMGNNCVGHRPGSTSHTIFLVLADTLSIAFGNSFATSTTS